MQATLNKMRTEHFQIFSFASIHFYGSRTARIKVIQVQSLQQFT
jgi:hypothetical protein